MLTVDPLLALLSPPVMANTVSRPQRVLLKELCGDQGCEREAAHPAAREQRDQRQAHRHLRCAHCQILSPSDSLFPASGSFYASPSTDTGGIVMPAARAEFGVEKAVEVEGLTADAVGAKVSELMKA